MARAPRRQQEQRKVFLVVCVGGEKLKAVAAAVEWRMGVELTTSPLCVCLHLRYRRRWR